MKYSAILYQSSGLPVSATEMVNEFGGAISWSTISPGRYQASLDSDVESFSGDYTAVLLLGTVKPISVSDSSIPTFGRFFISGEVNKLILETYKIVNGVAVLAEDLLVGTAVLVESVLTA